MLPRMTLKGPSGRCDRLFLDLGDVYVPGTCALQNVHGGCIRTVKTSSNATLNRSLQKAMQLHPDRGGKHADGAAFVRLLLAYRVLSNRRARQRYDMQLKMTVRAWPIRHAMAQQEQADGSSGMRCARCKVARVWNGGACVASGALLESSEILWL